MAPRQISELENVLQTMIDEHRKMLAQVDAQQTAMKAFKIDAMQDAMHRQDGSRIRIGNLEARRRLLVQQLAKLSRLSVDATLPQIAVLYPQNAQKLLGLRDELKQLMRQIADRTHVAGRLAAAVLGHLNTALRLFAGAVGQAGTYTKNGVPRVTQRIGVMEAVG
jgi:flagellar biosynthesis/type III secretory pathway chaperone